jgi:transmembrane sensor
MSRETAQEVDAAAALWAACADRGLTPAEEAQFEQWLAGDVRRPGAYARISWTMMRTERSVALGPSFGVEQSRENPPKSFTRRHAIAATGTALAASLIAAVLWRGPTAEAYETRKGERRIVRLEDGSTLTLNTSTRIEVAFSTGRRDVRLLEGEALFDVAKEHTRPFVVSADDTQVLAVGTSFTVNRAAPTGVAVVVREGIVEVNRNAGEARRVTSGNRALSSARLSAIEVTPVGDAEIHRELSWRNGQLVFSGEALDTAPGRFWRYSDTRIVIDDRTLGREEISGIFDADDPIGFASAVSLSLNARIHIDGREVHILR